MTLRRDEGGGWREGPSGGVGGFPGHDGGRFGRLLTRVFENPDNPLGWSLKLFTLWGIGVRIHLLTLLFVGVMLARSISPAYEGPVYSSLAMASLLVVVLLHEFGHCIACRMVGGAADRLVMLPFGGLALVRPPHHWRAHLFSALGGPLVNALLVVVTASGLLAAGMSQSIVFNPLRWYQTLSEIGGSTTTDATLRVALWLVHAVNLVILGLNLLIPAYPLDGGRVLQALLWRKMGHRAGTEVAVMIGLVSALVLLVMSVALGQVLVAVVGGAAAWSCWSERKRVRGEEDVASASSGIGGAPDLEAAEPDAWSRRAAQRRQCSEQREQREVDRILAIIAEHGMERLTRRERKFLSRATKKRRRR